MTAFLLALLEIIIRALLPALAAGASPSCEDGARQPALRAKLEERIRSTWGKVVLVLVVLAISGCTRTILVPPGEPVRLRETVKNVKVWAMGADGKPIAGQMDLPEGWYCLADEE